MVRKREKFKKTREMPRLTGTAVAAITAVVVVCFILALFSAGIIQPLISGSSTTTISAVNTAQSAIPASTLFNDYRTSPTYAAVNYTQQWVYVLANVSSVEKGTGDYQSCVNPVEPFLYGCSYMSGMSGWIQYTWDGSSQAAQVPLDTNFVAACYVVAWNIGDLYLDSCEVV
jgi:hypothetical protein